MKKYTFDLLFFQILSNLFILLSKLLVLKYVAFFLKKKSQIKLFLFLFFIVFFGAPLTSHAQIGLDFVPRYNGGSIRGNFTLIGNSALGVTTDNAQFARNDKTGIPINIVELTRQANLSTPFDYDCTNVSELVDKNCWDPGANNRKNMEYIDIDNDPNTFSSSSATLAINLDCKEILYAGLYWTAIYPVDRSKEYDPPYENSSNNYVGTLQHSDWNKIKFKIPGDSVYKEVEALKSTSNDRVKQDQAISNDKAVVIFNGYNKDDVSSSFRNAPYLCYADVTKLLQKLDDANGEYTVANIKATKGRRNIGSISGWTLVVVYKDDILPSKLIVTHDGFVNVQKDSKTGIIDQLDFSIGNFITPANGTVNGRVGIMAQEGEYYRGDELRISDETTNYVSIGNLLNPTDNFFNSTITLPLDSPVGSIDAYSVTNRNPSRENTFGFDLDVINFKEGFLRNNQEELKFQITTNGDGYAIALVALAIDVVAPKIELTQTVSNNVNLDLQGQTVSLGTELNYTIKYKNIGDDIATNLVIVDKIPEFVELDVSSIVVPNGITYLYDAKKRTITFTKDTNLEVSDQDEVISFKVKLGECLDADTYLMNKECSVKIENTINFTYSGVINQGNFEGSATLGSDDCEINPNILITNLDSIILCDKKSGFPICSVPTEIKAIDGFETYQWFKEGSNALLYEGQTMILNNMSDLGTYRVVCTSFASPNVVAGQACTSLNQIITVAELVVGEQVPFVGLQYNIESCSSSTIIPKFFLCEKPSVIFSIKIPEGGTRIVWEKSSCPLVADSSNCPDETGTCTWSEVTSTVTGDQSSIVADDGRYRVKYIFNNDENCIDIYPFNIYGSILPSETHYDIYCQTAGGIDISILGADNDYEYSLDGIDFRFKTKHIPIFSPGLYTVYIRPTSTSGSQCPPFNIKNIRINKRTISITNSDHSDVSCYGLTDGSISITAEGGRPGMMYKFTLRNKKMPDVTIESMSGVANFSNLPGGDYDLIVTNDDQCELSRKFKIDSPDEFKSSAVVTKNLTCTEAEITVTTIGGTPDYRFEIDVFDENNIQKVSDSYIITDTIAEQRIFKMPMYDKKVSFVLRVTDNSKCKEIVLEIPPFEPLESLDLKFETITHVNCNGSSTGAVKVNASGALRNYSYSLLNEKGEVINIPPINTSPATFTDLPAGNYIVHVVSEDCFDDFPFTIEEPPLIVPSIEFDDVTCAGFANVTVKVSATGGIGKLQYGISTLPNRFFDSGDFREIKAGIYIISVKDEKNCIKRDTITIVDPEPIVATVVESSIIQELCIGGKSGAFNIEIRGGTAPYSTSLNSATGPFVLGQLSFSNLSGGKHKVYIQDRYRCSFELPKELPLPKIKLNTSATITYKCEDNRPANQITARVDASNTDPSLVLFSLDGLGVKQHENVFKNVSPGSHFVRAEHADGCITDSNIVIVNQPNPPLTVSLELGRLNEFRIIINGGSGIYPKIKVNNEESNFIEKYTYYSSGTYTVTVTDSNGCTATATKPFEFVGLDVPNIFTPNGSGINDSWKPVHQEIYPDILIRIYDRYGREIAVLRYEESWDGTYKGVELPTGDYWYVIKLKNTKDDREFVGNVTLYR